MSKGLIVAACGVAIAITSAGWGATANTQRTAPPSAPSPPITPTAASAPAGLDSLTDDRLLADLANRGLAQLLDRAFDINKTPPAQRDALRSLASLKQLADPGARLSSVQRITMAKQAAAGIEA